MKGCVVLLALLACPVAASAQEAEAAVELSELAGTYVAETTGYQYVGPNAEACRCRHPNCDPPYARDHRTGTIAVAVEPASHAASVTVSGAEIPIVVEADGRFEGSLRVPATMRLNAREYEVDGSFGPDGRLALELRRSMAMGLEASSPVCTEQHFYEGVRMAGPGANDEGWRRPS